MGYPDGFQVDAARLRQVASGVERTSTAVSKACVSRQESLVPAGQACEGWSSVAATRAASMAWESFIRRLAGSVHDLSEDLRKAADEYRSSDEAAGERVAGTPWCASVTGLTLQMLLAADAGAFTAAAQAWQAMAEDLDNAAEDLIRGTRDLEDAWPSGPASQAAHEKAARLRAEVSNTYNPCRRIYQALQEHADTLPGLQQIARDDHR